MQTASFNVPSIACSTCSSKIQQGIKNLKGVNGVSVDLKTQTVNVDFNPSEIRSQDIIRQISAMGYEVV